MPTKSEHPGRLQFMVDGKYCNYLSLYESRLRLMLPATVVDRLIKELIAVD
jgi:hypothetical protein